MSQETNRNPQADVETRLGLYVGAFVSVHPDYQKVTSGNGWVIYAAPGMGHDEVMHHLLACLLTLGLWVPVFACLAILRTPKQFIIFEDADGIWIREFDPND